MGDPFAPITPAPVTPVAQSTTALIPPPLTPIAPPVTQSNGPLDQLGRFLFGQGAAPVGGFDPVAQPFAQAGANLFGPGGGGLLGDVPVIGNIGRAIGPIAGGTLGAVIKPFEAVATVASHIPTGFLPGGADEKFAQMGDWMKANRPADYAQWEVTNAAANADVLGGGNMKADFTRKWGTDYLNETKAGPTGFFAENPGLGLTASGSLGGGLMDALGIAGLFGQKVQKAIGGIEVAGGVTRIQQVLDRATANMDLNPIEQQVVDHLKDGSWTVEHAQNFIVEQGQGLSRDFIPQMLGSIGTDPLTFAMGGSSIALKVGKAGEAVIEAGQGARGALQTLQVVTKEVQASALAPVFKVGRSLVDPFSVLSKLTVTQGAVDLAAGAATKAIDGIYGAGSRSAAFETAAQRGITTELQSSLGAYSANLARKFVVTSFRATAMLRGVGAEKIAEVVPDSMIETLMKVAPTDVVTRLKDYGYGVRKVFMGNPADDQQLVGRLAAAFGGSTDGWVADVAKMSSEEKSLWHATTYAQSFKKFDEALANVGEYHGPLPLGRAVILNDHNLDNVSAEAIVTLMDEVSGSGVRKAWGEVLATLRKKGPVGDVFNPETGEIIVGATKKARIAFAQEKLAAVGENVTARAKVWNDAAAKYSDIADLGRAQPSKLHLDALVRDLQDLIDSGHLHRRVTLEELQAEPALKPLLDFLDAHNIGGEQLWNIGFRPDDFHAWGFARDRATGLLRVASDPYVSNVVDAVPAARPINDIARNFMGQIIGPVAAGKIVKPIEAMEVAIRTAADVVSGQRLLMNMEQRFTANISKLGVAGKDAKALFRAAKEAAQLQQTTIQGLLPVNVWKAVEDIIPLELKGVVTQRAIMDSLLDASNGDLRIMGITSGFTQRVRTMLQVHGLPDNYAGQATVNFYRMVRYSLNPTFYIQRVTDGIYFNILKGIAPVWTGRALKEGSPLWQAEQVLAKIGETSIARDFGMDMREYQLLSDFQVGLRTRLGTAAGGRLEGIATAGGRWQINNQIANIHAQLGNIVKESLDEARGAYEKLAADTTLSAAERQGYRNALDATNTYDSIAAQYSAAAGRALSPNEIGLKYIQEIFHDSLGQKLTPEGYLEYRHDIIAGTYHKPADIGELQTLSLEHLAADLGYVDRKGLGDVNALRRDISPTGQRSTEWVRERLREDFSADPDYINRAVSALTFDWNREWKDIAARLKLTARQSARLQGVVAREAIGRGMKPAEYMSQVLKTNLGGTDLDTHLGKLLSILTDKSVSATPEGIAKLTDVFMSTIDLSGQRTLVNGYMAALEGADGLIQKAYDAGDTALGQRLNQTLTSLKGGSAASGGAMKQAAGANLADLVARRAAGEAISNPDVEAIVRQFAKWSKETIGETLSKSGAAAHWISGLSKNIPIDGAFVYNRSEALVEQLLRQKVVLAQRDAFRLAEMSSQRTVASRSLNHPVFGLYPTSYMWGKVFPEMVKFLAQNPFGFEGAQGAYLMAKVQMAIAVQREYDPNFGTAMDALANSPTAFLVDYLTPSLPYSDMTAVTPPWARAMAKSGFDPGKMAEAEFRTIDPRRWASMFGQAGTEIVNTAKDMLSPKQQVPTVGPGALDNLISQPTQPKAQASQSSGAIGDLTAPLGNAMDELTTLFSH